MNELFLFAGLPGVGKSTISRAVSDKTAAKIIDLDDFKKTDVDPALVTSQIDPPELRWAYYQKALQHAFGLFGQGESIAVMDEVFHLNSLRTQLETLCRGHDVQVLWVEVRCPYETVAQRLHARTREGHILSTEEALAMYLRFQELFEEFPVCAKNHVVIDNGTSTNIDLVVQDILGAR